MTCCIISRPRDSINFLQRDYVSYLSIVPRPSVPGFRRRIRGAAKRSAATSMWCCDSGLQRVPCFDSSGSLVQRRMLGQVCVVPNSTLAGSN